MLKEPPTVDLRITRHGVKNQCRLEVLRRRGRITSIDVYWRTTTRQVRYGGRERKKCHPSSTFNDRRSLGVESHAESEQKKTPSTSGKGDRAAAAVPSSRRGKRMV